MRRDRAAFAWTAVGAGCLLLAQAAWWAIVFPANLEFELGAGAGARGLDAVA